MAYINGEEIFLFNVVSGTGENKQSKPEFPAEPDVFTPTISIRDNMLSITDASGLATSFDILVDGTVQDTTTVTSYDLSTLAFTEGTYTVTVIAKADGYNDSAESNAVSYIVEAQQPDTPQTEFQISVYAQEIVFGSTYAGDYNDTYIKFGSDKPTSENDYDYTSKGYWDHDLGTVVAKEAYIWGRAYMLDHYWVDHENYVNIAPSGKTHRPYSDAIHITFDKDTFIVLIGWD